MKGREALAIAKGLQSKTDVDEAASEAGFRPSEEEVSLLKSLCEIYSPSTHEATVAEFLVEELKIRGWKPWIDAAGNVVAEMGAGQREILFLGHCDTVPGYLPVYIEDGRLYGRGSVDAKGSLAAFICAAQRLRSLNARLVFIAAVGEEMDTAHGARHLVDRHPPDYCIIGEPSGWNGITLGYKGYIGAGVSICKPSAHMAGPSPSAAEEAIQFWNGVREICDRLNQGRRSRFDQIEPGLREICTTNDGLSDEARLRIELRLPMGCDVESLKRQVLTILPAATVTFTPPQECFRGDKNNALVRSFLAAIRACGGRPSFKLKSGTSDMNIVGPVWKCPMLAYGPGDSLLDHTPQENLPLDEYGRAIQVMKTALEELMRQG